MNLPDGLTDRELIEHLFGRVETLEGALRAALDLAMAAAIALPDDRRPFFSTAMASLQADRMTDIDNIEGAYIRSMATLQTNQRNGYTAQLRLASDRLEQYGIG